LDTTHKGVLRLHYTHYLSGAGDPPYKTFKIKRILNGVKTYLEIRQAGDLLDY